MEQLQLREQRIEQWLAAFPDLKRLNDEDRQSLLPLIEFKGLNQGDIAYYQGQPCVAYLMCITGRTRVFKTSETGRSITLYQVSQGETCVLTTSCLLAGRGFPAQSTADTDVMLAALPAPAFHAFMKRSASFREFVMGNYGELLSSLIALVDEVAFSNLDQRLARRLLAEADPQGAITTTHQQLAQDIGSVREVISRYLGEWERLGWIQASRGRIVLLNRKALGEYGGQVSV